MPVTVSQNPTGDEAVSGTWTGTAGSRYTLVDDYPDAAGTDRLVHGTTAGNLTFTFAAFSVPSDATVTSVAILYYDDRNGNQQSNIGGRLKVGGTYYDIATHAPTNGTLVQRTDTWTTNPRTSAAWTPAQVNGTDGSNDLQAFGWRSTDASPTIDLTSIRLDVTYDRDLTLTADAGTFTETGQAAALLNDHTLIGEAAVFTEAGQDAGLIYEISLRNLSLTADAATFTESGQDAGLVYDRLLTAEANSFAVSGQAALLELDRAVAAEAAAFALSGQDINFLHEHIMSSEVGVFALTGQDAGLTSGHYLLAAANNFNVTGRASIVRYRRRAAFMV